MKHLWALLSTLVLTSAIAVSGVAAWASGPSEDDAEAATSAAAASASASLVPIRAEHGFYWQLMAPQDVLAGSTLLVRRGAHPTSKGTRSDKEFFEISSTGSNDVPEAALRAYRNAEKVMATTDPGCRISWTLLAAIGRVESNHGRFGGSQLGSDGVSRPEIRGPRLDGAGPFAAIKDSDKGVLDHDLVWDRAVGQMQFLPQTWQSVARDGDGDGRMNPDDIDDSALGSAVYLCGAGGSLADPAGMARAAFRYNHSDYYVQLVLSFAAGYRTGVFAVPSPPPPPVEAVTRTRDQVAAKHPVTPATSAPKPRTPAPTPTVAAKPLPKPTPRPTPKPTSPPTPAGPQLDRVEGGWAACGPSFCLGDTMLDLGPAGAQTDRAEADFDGDGTVRTNAEEFAGLVGKHVSLVVQRNAGGFVPYVINGHDYRNADGSLARRAASAEVMPTDGS